MKWSWEGSIVRAVADAAMRLICSVTGCRFGRQPLDLRVSLLETRLARWCVIAAGRVDEEGMTALSRMLQTHTR
jgi:hypothetical protein